MFAVEANVLGVVNNDEDVWGYQENTGSIAGKYTAKIVSKSASYVIDPANETLAWEIYNPEKPSTTCVPSIGVLQSAEPVRTNTSSPDIAFG